MQSNTPLLLTDEQMRTFIMNGCLFLKTDFPREFHESLVEQLNTVYTEEGNPGNNLLPRIRELRKVFDHPVVTGALTSVLGPNYMMHAHRHGHFNASSVAGGWHKDSYWGYNRIRNHHPQWAMIMYFPQDTPVELGPTGVLPGTQNYESRTFEGNEQEAEVLASGEAGTFALIHYDIWHRSTPNVLGQPRYMLKFEFMRTEMPQAPSWNNVESEWRKPEGLKLPIAEHDLMWEESWYWLSGRVGSLADTVVSDQDRIHALAAELSGFEPLAINAAYTLAASGQSGVEALVTALRGGNANVSRIAAYGLSVAGRAAVKGLVAIAADANAAALMKAEASAAVEAGTSADENTDAFENAKANELAKANEEIIAHAVFALGELRGLASEAVPALVGLMQHSSEKIRCAVVDALGLMEAELDMVVAALAGGLQDESAQVRFMSSLALSRLGAIAEAAIPALEIAMDDENRYVRAHAAECLNYIGTERAKDTLIKFLLNARWCPTTSAKNAFYP
ncbi:phytanoyl-CoA dioxygenase [Paenibacillus pectinilyticus]|uniref:Phytanoyl-CoA dioxygenase n=1 Tax=Paenibacillus pectinilyticus TaxID=512399 RepID=A0A1C1A4X6_9BACL|nr:HEAT repeat domain-containing protein [Paenibacillus pectinilyticus]OCT15604.1 phytanoyl-CoA dioxygenase [Paenibacillus pectinilyticus]